MENASLRAKKILVGDLFAGIGGIALGLKQAGFEIIWANEFDKNACITYRCNFEHKMFEDDIHNLNPEELPKVDLIAGGFPCQAFSVAGYRKGFNDTRGTLFFEIMRLVDVLKPKYLFFENVKKCCKTTQQNTKFDVSVFGQRCSRSKGLSCWQVIIYGLNLTRCINIDRSNTTPRCSTRR